MSRIIKTIDIEGQPAVALFDSGAVNSYIRADLVAQAPAPGSFQTCARRLGRAAYRYQRILPLQRRD